MSIVINYQNCNVGVAKWCEHEKRFIDIIWFPVLSWIMNGGIPTPVTIAINRDIYDPLPKNYVISDALFLYDVCFNRVWYYPNHIVYDEGECGNGYECHIKDIMLQKMIRVHPPEID